MKQKNTYFLYSAIIITGYVADQITKWWARRTFSGPGGEPDYFNVMNVAGEWFRFRLVYNSGAAFGMKPQNLFPFLNPTVFYGLISLAAIIFLGFYFRRTPAWDVVTRTGLACILAGAFGNLTDRLILHKVTDFIDMGLPYQVAEKLGLISLAEFLGFDLPGLSSRWPTYNIADSMVCIGVGLLLLSPLFHKNYRKGPVVEENPL